MSSSPIGWFPGLSGVGVGWVLMNERELHCWGSVQSVPFPQLLRREGRARSPRMCEAGLWLTRAQRRTFHQSRPRREHFGELASDDQSRRR